MWNILTPPPKYDPWSTTIAYAGPNTIPTEGDFANRVIDPWGLAEKDDPEGKAKCLPTKLNVSAIRKTAVRQFIPFAEDACDTVLEESFLKTNILRKDMSKEEELEICQRSWKTETRACFAAALILLTCVGLFMACDEADIQAYAKYFQVAKGELFWRIIADSRIAGRLCIPPAPINLPHIRTIVMEILLLGATFAVVADLKFWFYQVPIHPGLQRIFGISCGGAFYRMLALPMGWPHSPRIAQCLAWAVIFQAMVPSAADGNTARTTRCCSCRQHDHRHRGLRRPR